MDDREQEKKQPGERELEQGIRPEQPEYAVPPVQPYRPPQMSSFRSPTGDPPSPGDPGFGGPSFTAPDPEPDEEPPFAPQQPAYVPPGPSEPPRSRSILGPLFLIVLGVLFLLQTLGLLPWSLWETLWRLWPAWLILVGLDMLLGRRGRWGSLLAVGLVVTIVGGVFYTVGFGSSDFRTASEPVALGETVQISQPAGAASDARVEISSGVSQLTLRSAPLSGSIIQGSIVPLRNEQVRQSYSVDGSTGHYRLDSEIRGFTGSIRGGSRGQWNLELTESMPVALKLSTGAGEVSVDLSQVQISDLRVESGVGETTIILPASGAFSGRIQAGVGEVIVKIPAGQQARIEVETGLGDVSTRGGFNRNGNVYTTPGYDAAADFIDLRVEGGVGTVRLEIDQ